MRKRFACVILSQLALPIAVAQLPPVPDKAGSDSAPEPRLFVAQRLHDLGTIFEGDRPTVRWVMENLGNADLIIANTRASCGCTLVKLAEEDKVIPPGESLAIKAEFVSTRRLGVQSKYITVYTNDPAESATKLEFTANVVSLYEIRPPSVVNLHAVRRGQAVTKTIDILPGPGRKSVEILDLKVPEEASLTYQHEPFDADGATGQRISMTVLEHVSMGALTTQVTVKLSIDGVDRERVIIIRGQVVGELTWHPKTVNATRQAARYGQRFAPVTLRSTSKAPFTILNADAGPLFDVTFEPVQSSPSGTEYSVSLTLRSAAPPGPFGTMLQIRTSLLNQPVVNVPIFGIVAAPIAVEPPMILLRQDGTALGRHRRVKLQIPPQAKLAISEITCDNGAVVATIDWKASSAYQHIRFLDLRLEGKLPQGTHRAVLTVTTNVQGAERLEVPVTIEVPGGRG